MTEGSHQPNHLNQKFSALCDLVRGCLEAEAHCDSMRSKTRVGWRMSRRTIGQEALKFSTSGPTRRFALDDLVNLIEWASIE